jgi:hypothetical protein
MRNRMNHAKEGLVASLNAVDWIMEVDTVYGCWNEMENKILDINDILAPL